VHQFGFIYKGIAKFLQRRSQTLWYRYL